MPLDPITGAAIIAGGSSLLNGIGNLFSSKSANNQNLKIARETNAQNYKMFQEQNAFNLDMFNRTNEYNSAVNQVKRLEAAGLNPALMMGNAGTASSVSSGQPNAAQSAHMDALPFAFDGSSVANTFLQGQLGRADIRKKNAEAFTQELYNKTAETRNAWEIGKLISDIGDKNANAAYKNFQAEYGYASMQSSLTNLKLQNNLLAQNAVNVSAQTDLVRYQAALAGQELAYLPFKQKAELAQYAANIYAARMAGLCSSKQADLLVEQKIGQSITNKGLKIDNKQKAQILQKLKFETNKIQWEAFEQQFKGRQAQLNYNIDYHSRPNTSAAATWYMRNANAVLNPLKGILSFSR